MGRQVALLRGVNVGGKNKVPMAALRALFESLGHTNVVTLIQSGNVVFDARTTVTSSALEEAIEKEFGLDITVMVRTSAQLRHIIESRPFPGADETELHV